MAFQQQDKSSTHAHKTFEQQHHISNTNIVIQRMFLQVFQQICIFNPTVVFFQNLFERKILSHLRSSVSTYFGKLKKRSF